MNGYRLVKLLLQLFIVALLFGQLSRITLPGGGEGAVFLYDFILVGLIGVWFLWRWFSRRGIEVTIVDWSIGLLAFTTAISWLFSLHWLGMREWSVAGFYWIRLVLYLSLFRVTATLWNEHRYDPLPLLEKIGFIFALFGLAQFILFPDFSKYVQHGWDPHYYRVLSTFFDPNYAGMFLIFSFFLSLHQLYSKSNAPHIEKLWRVLMLGTIGVAALLTFSRSTYLALLIGLTIFGWLKDKRILLGMVIVGTLAFATIPRVRTRVIGALQVDETASLRLKSYERTWKIIQDNPVLGVGFNAYRYAQEDYGYFRDARGVTQPGGHAGAGSDNSVLFIWAAGGVISLLALLIWLAVSCFKMLVHPWNGFLLASLVAFFVHAQFVNSFFYTALLAWFLIVSGTSLERFRKNEK